MQSVLDIKRAVRELQKEVAELKAKVNRDDATAVAFAAYALGHSVIGNGDSKTATHEVKPDGKKRPYRRRNPSAD